MPGHRFPQINYIAVFGKSGGQSYKASTIVIYESRVINMSNLIVTTTVESWFTSGNLFIRCATYFLKNYVHKIDWRKTVPRWRECRGCDLVGVGQRFRADDLEEDVAVAHIVFVLIFGQCVVAQRTQIWNY